MGFLIFSASVAGFLPLPAEGCPGAGLFESTPAFPKLGVWSLMGLRIFSPAGAIFLDCERAVIGNRRSQQSDHDSGDFALFP